VPDEAQILLYERGVQVNFATKLREEYILQILNTIRPVRSLIFVSTAYGNKKGPFATKTYLFQEKSFVFLGYYGKRILKHISSYLIAFFWIIKNVKQGDIVITYNFPIVYAIPIVLKKIVMKFHLIIESEDFFNKNDMRYYMFGPFEWLGIKMANAFVASSQGMKDYIECRRKNAKVIINGGYVRPFDLERVVSSHVADNTIKILYSGTLDEERGIENLLALFQQNKSAAFELLITGIGPLADKAVEASEKDKRISYLGILKEEDYHNLISSVEVCVNPQWSAISVNFPSKITTYLSYGKIVLSTKIRSLIESPYQELLIFYEEQDVTDFWDKLYNVSSNIEQLRAERMKRINLFREIVAAQNNAFVNLVSEYSLEEIN